MPPDCHEKKMYGKDTDVLCRAEDHTVYRLGGTDGDVTVTAYPVFPGIEILYNDVHATMRVMELAQEPKVIEINHCLEGRIEYQFGSEFYFLAPGDMSIARRHRFPQCAHSPRPTATRRADMRQRGRGAWRRLGTSSRRPRNNRRHKRAMYRRRSYQ